MTLETLRKRTQKFILQDEDFKKAYNKNNKTNMTFENIVKQTCDNMFNGDYIVVLDKAYLDVSYLKINNYLIDLDLAYEIFKNEIMGY